MSLATALATATPFNSSTGAVLMSSSSFFVSVLGAALVSVLAGGVSFLAWATTGAAVTLRAKNSAMSRVSTQSLAVLLLGLLDDVVGADQMDGGIVRLKAFAVRGLTTSSNFIGYSIGRSPGFAPFRISST